MEVKTSPRVSLAPRTIPLQAPSGRSATDTLSVQLLGQEHRTGVFSSLFPQLAAYCFSAYFVTYRPTEQSWKYKEQTIGALTGAVLLLRSNPLSGAMS
jgi:hypothetical protein